MFWTTVTSQTCSEKSGRTDIQSNRLLCLAQAGFAKGSHSLPCFHKTRKLELGNLGRKLEAANNWRQRTWNRELGQGTGGTGDRELGTGNWRQGTGAGTGAGTGDKELGQQTGDRNLGQRQGTGGGNWGL